MFPIFTITKNNVSFVLFIVSVKGTSSTEFVMVMRIIFEIFLITPMARKSKILDRFTQDVPRGT